MKKLILLCSCIVGFFQVFAGPLFPEQALKKFEIFEDLQVDQLMAEPLVKQPVFLNFDERGRMWVVQYLQYPNPAGLKLTSRDNYLRAVYDKTQTKIQGLLRGRRGHGGPVLRHPAPDLREDRVRGRRPHYQTIALGTGPVRR